MAGFKKYVPELDQVIRWVVIYLIYALADRYFGLTDMVLGLIPVPTNEATV